MILEGENQKVKRSVYRVTTEKVLFGIFGIIMIAKNKKNSIMKSKGEVLSPSKFPRYMMNVKIIKISHQKGLICPHKS